MEVPGELAQKPLANASHAIVGFASGRQNQAPTRVMMLFKLSQVQHKRETPALTGERCPHGFTALGNDFHGSVQNRPPAKAIEFLLVDDGVDAHRELDRSMFIVNDPGTRLG